MSNFEVIQFPVQEIPGTHLNSNNKENENGNDIQHIALPGKKCTGATGRKTTSEHVKRVLMVIQADESVREVKFCTSKNFPISYHLHWR